MLNCYDHFLESGAIIATGENKLLLGWGKRTWIDVPDALTPSFYFPDFFLQNKQSWFIHEHWHLISIDELLKELSSIPILSLQPLEWHQPDQHLFHRIFHELQAKFQVEELIKAVPFVFDRALGKRLMTHQRLVSSLCSALRYAAQQPAFFYGFWDNDQGILGATPELLFRLNQKHRHLETAACAGTLPAGEQLAQTLEHHPTLIREHQVVVEGIAQSLSPLGNVSIDQMQLLTLPKLCHLFTPIQLRMDNDHSIADIIAALHPTPALGAFPKVAGWQWLKDYQTKIDRKRYGAPVGYVIPELGEAASLVAIRNMQWDEEAICIGAGCGLVEGCQWEKEWREIELKIAAIKEILAI